MTMYEKFCQLGIDGRWIGLEKSDMCVDYDWRMEQGAV